MYTFPNPEKNEVLSQILNQQDTYFRDQQYAEILRLNRAVASTELLPETLPFSEGCTHREQNYIDLPNEFKGPTDS